MLALVAALLLATLPIAAAAGRRDVMSTPDASASADVVLIATAIACWPVWPWYVAHLGDSGDDAAALVALLLLAVLPARAPVTRAGDRPARAAAVGARAGRVRRHACHSFRAWRARLLAFLALGFAWSLVAARHAVPSVGRRPGLLGLPMASSLQFYLGYPLRIASGAVALVLLRLGRRRRSIARASICAPAASW